MNKLISKIVGAFLGVTMATGIGVGVAVGSQNRSFEKAEAAYTQLDNLTPTSLGLTTSYGSSSSGNYQWTQLMKGQSSIQGNSSKQSVLWNKTALSSDIAKIELTIGYGAGANNTASVAFATSAAATTYSTTIGKGTDYDLTTKDNVLTITNSNSGCRYFTITWTSGASYYSSIKIFSGSSESTDKTLTYAVGTNGTYDGTTTKSFSVPQNTSATVKNPSEVGMTPNTGYVFNNWTDGTSNNIAPGDSYPMGTSDHTLTAQWVAGVGLSYNPVSDSGTGTGSMDTTYVISGGTQTVASCTFTAPSGKQFSHWNTSADDNGTSYDPEDEIEDFDSAVTLYAIWEAKLEVTFAYPGGSTTNMTGGNDAATLGASATDWSVVGFKNGSQNFPGLNSGGYIATYGNNQNYIVIKTLATAGTRYLTSATITTTTSTYYRFNVYEGEADFTTALSPETGTSYTFNFGENVTAFTIRNNNSSQSRITGITVSYRNVAITTPTINLSETPSVVGIGTNTAQFTVKYYNLTSAFSVSTTVAYVTASYTGASGTGEKVVTLSGVATIASTTITVSSSGAESQSFTVSVEVLPVVNAALNTATWGSSTYATSPHTVTWNSSYEFVVSAGQHTGGSAYLGTNNNNMGVSLVSGNDWTLSGSSIDTAITNDADASWLAYGQALYMSNFGVLHPTQFTVSVGSLSGGNTPYSGTYYILASADSGDSWTVLETGSIAIGNLSWTGNTYASNSNQIQFAFVTTSSSYGSVYDLTVKVWGDSYNTTKVLDSIYVSGTPKTTYKVGESFDLNGAKVKAHYTDSVAHPDEDVTEHVTFSNIVHGTTEVTITYATKTTTVNVSVSDEGTVYKKVTNTNELIEGAKVIIGTSNGAYTAGAQGHTDKNRNPEAAGGSFGYYEDGDIENWSVNTTVFTIGITENGYTFHDGDGYLYAASDSDNIMRVEAELDENQNGEWSISITDGVATIVSQGSHTHNTMNGNGTAFSVYASPTVSISLYSDVANTLLEGFGENYLFMSTYDQGGSHGSTGGNGSCSNYYVTAKTALLAMGSVYVNEFQSNNALNPLQARYEDWAIALGDSTPYAGTGIVPAQNANSLLSALNMDNTAVLTLVVTFSVLGFTTLGGYFLLRKKKEER